MEVLLDSSFIISCVKRKIDFISELEGMGFKVLLPKEVFQEIKDLELHSARETRIACGLALEMFEKRKVKSVALGDKRQADEGLIEMGKRGAYIATLDAAIKRSVPNKVIIEESSNSLVVERA
jgi:rRNA-processing protein FCF1